MGSKHSKSRRQSKVTVDNQRKKSQNVPPLAPPDDERQTKGANDSEESGRHEKLSTKTQELVGLTGNSEQQSSIEVTGGCSVSKGSPSNVVRPRPCQERHEIEQVVHEASVVASDAAAASLVVIGGSSSSGNNSNNHNIPLPSAANATDGYISFSESESDISASSPAASTTTGIPGPQPSSAGDVPNNDHHTSLPAGGGQEESRQDRPSDKGGAKSDGASGDDMWNFGDEDSDDEQAHSGRVATVKSPAARIGGGVGGGGNDGNIDELQQARVVVDRLGRRENAPRR